MTSTTKPLLKIASLGPLPECFQLDSLGSVLVQSLAPRDAVASIQSARPNVLLTDDQPGPAVEEAFTAANRGRWSCAVRNGALSKENPDIAKGQWTGIFQRLERDFARSSFARDADLITTMGAGGGRGTVCVVGAGIIGLMAALALREAGHQVHVVEASPAPQSAQWQHYGCTHGGEDARMYSVTEYDNYNEKRDRLYADMGRIFDQPLSQGGWLAMDAAARTQEELDWNNMFRRVPVWLAQGFSQEIFDFCGQARAGWRAIFSRYPALKARTGLREGVVRTYDDPVKFEAARVLQAELGALESTLTPAEVCQSYPLFAAAVGNGAICGALEVAGFTVQIHKFTTVLIEILQEQGVTFEWNCRATRLLRDANQVLCGVRTEAGMRHADHYVLSPGAYGNAITAGFAGGALVHGVIGAWLVLPHLGGSLARSAKIKRTAELNEDVNVTVGIRADGMPTITLGSGYGYLGSDPLNLDPDQLQLMYQQLDRIAERYFPEAYEAALQNGMAHHKKYCVRPWTPSGLGVFECQSAQSGLAVLVGGHNTGGFAVAPIAAQSVCSALSGQIEPSHWQFAPSRLAAAVPALHHLVC